MGGFFFTKLPGTFENHVLVYRTRSASDSARFEKFSLFRDAYAVTKRQLEACKSIRARDNRRHRRIGTVPTTLRFTSGDVAPLGTYRLLRLLREQQQQTRYDDQKDDVESAPRTIAADAHHRPRDCGRFRPDRPPDHDDLYGAAVGFTVDTV